MLWVSNNQIFCKAQCVYLVYILFMFETMLTVDHLPTL